MISPSLNYFSLLIPIFLLTISTCIVGVRLRQKISSYLLWFAVAIASTVLLQFFQLIVIPNDFLMWAPLSCLLFLVCITLTTYAIFLRLNIEMHWGYIALTIVFTFLGICYFAYVQPNLVARLSLAAIGSFVISMNNLKGFISCPPRHFFDRLLKLSLVLVIACIILRALFLIFLYQHTQWLNHVNFIWASTQFITLFFSITIFTLLCGCSIHDSILTLERERNIDPLTGLLNRRALGECLQRLFSTPSQFQHALLLCDVDFFKKINDQYGHEVGDLALKHVSQLLTQFVRYNDEIARIGGEEFQIVLINVEPHQALRMSEHIRQAIQNHPLMVDGKSLEITLSIGLSYFNTAEEYATANKQADALLYQAKNFGRNNVQWQLYSKKNAINFNHLVIS